MATLIYLSQTYSYYIRGDRSPLNSFNVNHIHSVIQSFIHLLSTTFLKFIAVITVAHCAWQLSETLINFVSGTLGVNYLVSGPEIVVCLPEAHLEIVKTMDTCKAKRQYLLTLQVSRYCLLALQSEWPRKRAIAVAECNCFDPNLWPECQTNPSYLSPFISGFRPP